MTHLLFSYGTLQLEKVQLESFGRKLKGNSDILLGYKLEQLQITNPDVLAKSEKEFHPIAVKSSDSKDKIEGAVFEISEEELRQADAYEVADYKRVSTILASQKKAWVYVG